MRRYGLLGRSLSHSFSQRYFTEKFQKEGIDARYDNFEAAEAKALKTLMAQYPDLKGLNVTIPFKVDILEHLDALDPAVAAVGAANTVVIREGRTKGYNTDIDGFRAAIKPFLAHGMERALILGTGGASKAVRYVLENSGIETLTATRYPAEKGGIGYDQLNENAVKFHRLIVNATPLGTWPNVDNKPDLPYAGLTPDHLLFDLVYHPAETAFLRAGQAAGAKTLNGLQMLHIQAEKSWELWNS